LSSLNPLGTPFIELLSVDSTNNYAMGLVRAAMAHHGTAVFAHEQTMGKGQRNKGWLSQKDQNIAISIVLEPEKIRTPGLFLLSMASALATRSLIEKQGIKDLKIKWPNDIYWRDRKAAGILIENLWQGEDWKFSVVGIGMNVNQEDFGELSSKAVSLKQIAGREFDTADLARKLCNELDEQVEKLIADPPSIIAAYKQNLYKLNDRVKLKKANRVFEAMIADVTINGELVVNHAVEERFAVGEVEWIV
jgi:BirA family biotin operon repressor/biotin-[acetyl-CoA-carboxylase] ligase